MCNMYTAFLMIATLLLFSFFFFFSSRRRHTRCSRDWSSDVCSSDLNRLCRENVFKYKADWETLSERIAYWLDYEHPYVTYTNDYIATVWWLLKRLYDKALLYRGHKVLPYCPRCGTALSSHELALGYEEVQTNSVFVTFPLASAPNRQLVIWTTTPWTLLEI